MRRYLERAPLLTEPNTFVLNVAAVGPWCPWQVRLFKILCRELDKNALLVNFYILCSICIQTSSLKLAASKRCINCYSQCYLYEMAFTL